MKAFPCTSVYASESERNFIAVTDILTAKDIPTVAGLLFINLVGPPMHQFGRPNM